MTDQERIQVLFEAIEKQLEAIAKSIKDLPKTLGSPADNSSVDIANKLAEFTDKLREAKFTIPNSVFQAFENKVNELKIEIKKLGTPIKAEIIKTEHYFFFFPDLKSWLMMVKQSKFIWALAGLLLISVAVNFYLGKDYSRFKDSDMKYRYLRNFGGYSKVDTIAWLDQRWPNIKERVSEAVEKRENDLRQSNDKEQMKMELRKKLDSLEKK